MGLKFSAKFVEFMRQFLRCLVYLGLGHTAFEIALIVRTPEIAHLWYYAVFVPGLYYLIAILALWGFIAIADKKR